MKSTTLSSIALLAFFALSKADEPSLSTHVTGPCDAVAFEAFLQQYGKTSNYGHSSTNEYKKRCGAFTLVKNAVDAHNADTNKSITLQLNEHSDLFPEERKARNGLKVDLDPTPSQPSDSARRRRLSQRLPERRNLQTLPTSIDYTTTDNSFGVVAVTDIKNQGQCGVSIFTSHFFYYFCLLTGYVYIFISIYLSLSLSIYFLSYGI